MDRGPIYNLYYRHITTLILNVYLDYAQGYSIYAAVLLVAQLLPPAPFPLPHQKCATLLYFSTAVDFCTVLKGGGEHIPELCAVDKQ